MASPTTPHPDPAHGRSSPTTANRTGLEALPEAPLPPPPPPPPGWPPGRIGPDELAPGHGSDRFKPSETTRPAARLRVSPLRADRDTLAAVGPGLGGQGLRANLMTGYPFPITGAKIHPPLVRPDTLSRRRLNEWLDRAAGGRVGLIVA